MAPPSAAQLDEAGRFFAREGYAVLPSFLSPAQTARLKDRMAVLLSRMDLAAMRERGNPFVANSDQIRVSDEYFLTSGDVVRPFFEDCRELEVNKVGHALHALDPVFRDALMDDSVHATLAAFGMKRPMPVQSMYILKSARLGGEVAPHQDATFLITSPQSVVGLWVALEDATVTNGCLWAVPGSHAVPCERLFLRNATNTGTVFEPPTAPELHTDGAVALQVKAGTLVALHGSLVHFSYANTSGKSRHAYTVHFVEADLPWHPRNWLQSRLFAPLRERPSVACLDVSALARLSRRGGFGNGNHQVKGGGGGGSDEEEWSLKALAYRFDLAMRRCGTCVLVGHSMDPKLATALRSKALAFFAQPASSKQAFAAKGGYGTMGYHGLAKEAVGNAIGSTPDPVESLYYTPQLAPSLAPAQLRNELVQVVEAMTLVAQQIYSLAELALGIPTGTFEALGHDDYVKISHYSGKQDKEQVLYGAHTDYAGFTLLLPDEQGSSSLQVFIDGEWRDVQALSGAIVVNAGDFFPVWSGGRWQSPLHRVVGRGHRLSVPLFTGPGANAVVRPLVAGGHGRDDFTPFVAGQWLEERRNRSNV